jgi:hypothetical protein
MSQDEAFAFLRELTIPEDRWFRAPNVVCLEHYRRRRQRQQQAGPGNPKTP